MQVIRSLQGLLSRPRLLAPLFESSPLSTESVGSSGGAGVTVGAGGRRLAALVAARDTAGPPFLAARVAAHLEHVLKDSCNCGNIDHCVGALGPLSLPFIAQLADEQFAEFATRVVKVAADFSAASTAIMAGVRPSFGAEDGEEVPIGGLFQGRSGLSPTSASAAQLSAPPPSPHASYTTSTSPPFFGPASATKGATTASAAISARRKAAQERWAAAGLPPDGPRIKVEPGATWYLLHFACQHASSDDPSCESAVCGGPQG